MEGDKKRGENQIYETIFEFFPDVEFIIDSSKDIFWIEKQSKNLITKGIEVRNILIWKTSEKITESYYKRGRVNEWHKR